MNVFDLDDPDSPFSQEVWLSIIGQDEDVLDKIRKGSTVSDDDMYDAIFDGMDF